MVMPWRLRRVDRAPSEWEMRGTLGVLALLVGLAGVAPLTWLGSKLQLALPPSPAGMDLAATALLVLAGVGAVLLYPAVQRLTQWPRPQKRLSRRLVWLGERSRVDVLIDPYLIVGGILLGLGRASAAVLHHTLGRLARAG